MDRLGHSLFNHMRGYLSFRELHAKRVINKTWSNIESVPKSFDETKDPPVRACFKNVTSFFLHLSPHTMSLPTIENILSSSRRTLKKLMLFEVPAGITFVPRLENVEYICTPLNNGKLFNNMLLKRCPNVKTIELIDTKDDPNYVIDIDFAEYPMIERVFIGDFSNGRREPRGPLQVRFKNLTSHTGTAVVDLPFHTKGKQIADILRENAKLRIRIQEKERFSLNYFEKFVLMITASKFWSRVITIQKF